MLQRPTTSKFPEKKSKSCILLKKYEAKQEIVVKKQELINCPCNKSFHLSDDVVEYCTFSVTDDGVYNICTQLCVKQTGKSVTRADTLQIGLCESDDYENGRFSSYLLNADIEPDYMITKNLSVMMQLKTGVTYNCWCMLSSENNDKFKVLDDYSYVKLFNM